jgi:very-short-patch-repair endonuclease
VAENKKPRIPPAIKQRAIELRLEQTPAEKKLWCILHDRRLGEYKFRRQHPIGTFIIDFYCAEARLVIEIDGDSHADQVDYDLERTKWLQYRDYHVIRFTNRDVHQNLSGVAERILEVCERLKEERG